MDIRRIKVSDFLFFNALICYCAHYFLNASLLEEILPNIFFTLLKIVILALLFLKWMTVENFTEKKIFTWGIILSALLLVMLTGGYRALMLSVCLIISGQNVDFDKIIKVLFFNTIFWLVVIVLLCKIGILPDYTFEHNVGGVSTVAHSFGFKYYSWIGYISMAATMMWIYLRKRLNIFELGILVALNVLLYKFHTTNLPLGLTLLFILAYFVVEKMHIIQFKSKVWKMVATILPVVLCSFTFTVVIAYGKGLFSLSISWMNTIVSRLKYSVQAIEEYGIHLYATNVEQLGNTAKVYGEADSSFYIDSGYVYSIIAYGIIFTVIILVFYTILFRYLYKNNNRILYIWITSLLFASCVNNFLYDIINNPVLFLIPTALFNGGSLKNNSGKRITLTHE